MIRATRSIVTGAVKQTLRIVPLSPPLPFPVFPAASMWFSTLQEPKIFEMMKGKVDSKGADIIFIEMATLSDKQRKEAIRLFLDRIFEGNIDPSYIAHQKFNVHLKKDPDMLFEAYFFRIGEYIGRLMEYIQKKEIRAKKMAARQINESFVICFDAIKRMSSDETPYKEIQLYKAFAHYHAVFLKMLVEPPKMKMCLTKARDLYKGSLTKIMMQVKVLVENEKKLKQSLKLEETINVTKSQKQEAIQLVREGNYRLFEHFSEAILEIVNIQLQLDDLQQKSKLQKDAIEDPNEVNKAPLSREQRLKGMDLQSTDSISLQQKLQFPKAIASMEVIIDKAVKNYTLVKEFIHKSQFYSKLKKMNIQISYQNDIRKAYKQKSQQDIDRLKDEAAQKFIQKMDELFNEGAMNFKKLCSDFQDPQMLEDQCLQMAEIKMNCFQLTEGDLQALLSQVGEDLQGVISIIPDQKFRKNIVNNVVKHVKELYQVDISKFLEKVPRNLRISRRPRSVEKK